jgi:hypothetical protein
MITREQIELAFGDDRNAFQTKDIDHDLRAITLLRERIPYEACKNIIVAAEHDVIYLCDLETAMPYLNEDDLNVLADCNVWVEEEYCFALFV